MSFAQTRRYLKIFIVDYFKFESVDNFTYLESDINSKFMTATRS